ncbi:hypothetical protein MVEG_04981 [Podila verticillata NRRL 6337]|nr:hypothetical protein MVEG_04981 [Podila verticillata NRRL 6337]
MFLKMGADDISSTNTVPTSTSSADICSQEELSVRPAHSESPNLASTSTSEGNGNRAALGTQPPPLPEHSNIPSQDEEMVLANTSAQPTLSINISSSHPVEGSCSSSTSVNPATSDIINEAASGRSEALALFTSLLKRSTEEAELLKLTDANTRANSGPSRKRTPRKSTLFSPSPPRSKRPLLEILENSDRPLSPCYMADDEEEYDAPEKSQTSRDSDASSPRKRRRSESSFSSSDLALYPAHGGSVRHQSNQGRALSLPLTQLVAELPKKESERSIKTVRINEELNTILEFDQNASVVPPSDYAKEQQQAQEQEQEEQEKEQASNNKRARPIFSFLSLSSPSANPASTSTSTSCSSSTSSEFSLSTWPWPPSQATLPMDMDTESTDQPQDQDGQDDQDHLKPDQEQESPFVMSLANTSQQVLDFTASLNRLWAPPKLRTSFSDMSFNASKSREAQSTSPRSTVSTSWSPDPAAFSSFTAQAATQTTNQPRLSMMRREMSMPSLGASLDFWSKAPTSSCSEKAEVPSVQETSSRSTVDASPRISVIESAGGADITSPPRNTRSSAVTRIPTSSKSKERGADRSRSREETLFHPYRRSASGASLVSSSFSAATSETPRTQPLGLLQEFPSPTPPLGRSASFSGSARLAPVLKRQASTSAIKDSLQTDSSTAPNAAEAT